MEVNQDALKEVLNTQIGSVEAFNMGEDLMKNAVNDIETLSRTAATLSKTENDDEKHELEMELLKKKDEREERESNANDEKRKLEMELLKKKDEREERESKTRIKQGWFSVGGSILGGVVSFLLYTLMNVDQAIDEHNGDIRSRSQVNLAKTAGDAMIRAFRGKKG